MKKGFTLIELLVVVAIIGLLSTVIAAAIMEGRCKKAGNCPKAPTEEQECQAYKNYAQKDLPAKCLKYYK